VAQNQNDLGRAKTGIIAMKTVSLVLILLFFLGVFWQQKQEFKRKEFLEGYIIGAVFWGMFILVITRTL